MRSIIIILILFAVPTAGFSATIHVPQDYPKIQEAIDAAVNGDVVLVAPGTYAENITFKGRAIAVRSTDGPVRTVIDGGQDGSVVTFDNSEKPTSILDGFTVTNGSGTFGGVEQYGGGVCCVYASPTITSNIICDNRLNHFDTVTGGGIHCEHSEAHILNNVICGNTLKSWSIGVGFGAGIYVEYGSPSIKGNIIFDNQAMELKYGYGAGIFIRYAEVHKPIMGNIIVNNSASKNGGGISCSYAIIEIINNTLALNWADCGGAVGCWSSDIKVSNSVIWNNDSNDGYEFYLPSEFKAESSLDISYSDLEGGRYAIYAEPYTTVLWGPGMINADPLFVDSAMSDVHLSHPSPCKDSGSNSEVPSDLLKDFEGDPRIADQIVDMGADEFYTHLYWMGDATPGGCVELKFIGLPGTFPVQLWLGSGVLDPPWPTIYGNWHLEFPLLAAIPNLGAIPSPEGVLVFPFTFPVDTPIPLILPFQSGIGMELTNLSLMEVK